MTVPETAQHLFTAFGEEVNEADIFRLVLDGQLKLSVNFNEPFCTQKGNFAANKYQFDSDNDMTVIDGGIFDL